MKIIKECSFLKTYFLEGNEIRAFRFYSKKDGVIVSQSQGYLDYYDNSKEIELPDLKKRIRKDNMLEKGGCFYTKHENLGASESFMGYDERKKYDIYLDIDDPNISFQYIGETVDTDYPTETTYKKVYNITICNKLFVIEEHCTRREAKSCKNDVNRFIQFLKDSHINVNDYEAQKIYFALLDQTNEFFLFDRTKYEGDKFFDSL